MQNITSTLTPTTESLISKKHEHQTPKMRYTNQKRTLINQKPTRRHPRVKTNPDATETERHARQERHKSTFLQLTKIYPSKPEPNPFMHFKPKHHKNDMAKINATTNQQDETTLPLEPPNITICCGSNRESNKKPAHSKSTKPPRVEATPADITGQNNKKFIKNNENTPPDNQYIINIDQQIIRTHQHASTTKQYQATTADIDTRKLTTPWKTDQVTLHPQHTERPTMAEPTAHSTHPIKTHQQKKPANTQIAASQKEETTPNLTTYRPPRCDTPNKQTRLQNVHTHHTETNREEEAPASIGAKPTRPITNLRNRPNYDNHHISTSNKRNNSNHITPLANKTTVTQHQQTAPTNLTLPTSFTDNPDQHHDQMQRNKYAKKEHPQRTPRGPQDS
mmetsp:Transcript_18418/g.28050  ORF Transcript_18418/g.28050 Transcript_18418/m.28050 type:complete len:393 (-) Transcript_18418:79-1257(-)